MPVNITIRNVPDTVHGELAARAARSGQSMQEYLMRQLVDLTSRPSMREAVARARAHAEELPPLSVESVLDDIRAGRPSD